MQRIAIALIMALATLLTLACGAGGTSSAPGKPSNTGTNKATKQDPIAYLIAVSWSNASNKGVKVSRVQDGGEPIVETFTSRSGEKQYTFTSTGGYVEITVAPIASSAAMGSNGCTIREADGGGDPLAYDQTKSPGEPASCKLLGLVQN